MRRRILLASVLTMAIGLLVSVGLAETFWKLRVHHEGQTDEYILSRVDSLSFLQETTPVPEMVRVPAGVFIMGDGNGYCCQEDEREVTLTRDFYIGQHEVTNQEYMEALQWAYDRGYVTATTSTVRDNLDGSTEELLDLDHEACEIQFDGVEYFYLRESPYWGVEIAYPDGYDPSNHPVQKVAWFGAARYCDWLSIQTDPPLARAYEHTGDWACNGGDPYGAEGYRLPTDAEWEYAAQYDDERLFPWGNAGPHCGRANYNIFGQWCVYWTRPVGSYPDAPAELGLSDMAGNVFEWCNDWFVCDLGTTPEIDPVGPSSGSSRVTRGASWNFVEYGLYCASRCDVTGQNEYIGVRFVRTVGR